MRKLFVLTIMLFFSVSAAFADTINLGDFPVGKWLDSNYDAIWEFSTGNIKIISPAGKVYCNFSNKTVQDFKIDVASDLRPQISFYCPETGKKYIFKKSLTNLDVELQIERTGKPLYSSNMKMQR